MTLDFIIKLAAVIAFVVIIVALEVVAMSVAEIIIETSDDDMKRKLKERQGEHSDSKNKETDEEK